MQLIFVSLTNSIWKWLKWTTALITACACPLAKAFDSPLNGKHLIVIWNRLGGVFNESYTGPKKGGDMIEYIARRFNFTFEYLNYTVVSLNDTEKAMDLILTGQCDVAVRDAFMTAERNQIVEMLYWFSSNFGFVFQVSDDSTFNAKIDAIAKPYQWPVWISIFISIILVIIVYKIMQNLVIALPLSRFSIESNPATTATRNSSNSVLYVIGMLVSQGGPCISKSLIVRIVAGVWCLAAFVLVQAYTSLLITYILAPNSNPPLIESVHDITKNPDIKLVCDKTSALDRIISTSVEKEGLFKKLRDRLDKYPDSRCTKVECISLLTNKKPKIPVVYGVGYEFGLDAIINERNKENNNGKCNLQLAKENFLRLLIAWMVAKNSPYRNSLAIGLLELEERGLMRYWDQWYRRIPPECLVNTKKAPPKKHGPDIKSRLSLKNLTGAFVVLFVGYALAFLSFIIEKIVFLFSK